MGSYDAESGLNYQDGHWHHLAAVFDRDGDFTPYVDGVALSPTDISGLTDNLRSGHGAFIGEYNPGFEAGKWDGQLDEIRIWKTALTGNQIRAWSHREVNPEGCGGRIPSRSVLPTERIHDPPAALA